MEDLKILTEIISKQKIKNLEVISRNNVLTTKAKQLYDGLANELYKDEDEAALDIYGTDAKNPTFKKLKYRLRKKLINTLFIVDPSDYGPSDYSNKLLDLTREYLASRILLKTSGSIKVRSSLEKIVRLSEKLEEPGIGFLALQPLITNYSFVDENPKKLKLTIEKSGQFLTMLQNEQKIFLDYGVVSQLYLLNRTSYSEKYKNTVKEIYHRIKDIDPNKQSYRYNVKAFELIAHHYQIINENQKRIEFCKTCIEFFKQKKFQYVQGEYLINNELIDAYLEIRDYPNAQITLQRNKSLIPSTFSFSYFKLMLWEFSLLSVQFNWRGLYELTIPIMNNKALKARKTMYQSWLIREAYVYLLIKIGKINTEDSRFKAKSRFRLNRNINELPVYAKKNRGINIPIIILQLLFLIADKKYDQIYDRVHALNQYCHKNLRQDETFRSNCFIKMLMKLPEAEYHPKRLVRYADKYKKKLATKPYKLTFRGGNAEVIPYEVLWDLVMELLNINLASKVKPGTKV